MPAEEVSAAIALRSRDYSESDRIVTLLTRDYGKLGGIAKGARKSRVRFERKLEPFSHVMLYFRRRPNSQLVFITRAEAAELPQFNLGNDLGRFALGNYMLELADALASEEAEAAGAYRILTSALTTLSRESASWAIRQAFELKMLAWAGYGVEFGRCRACGTTLNDNGEPAYFVLPHGGVICSRCRPSVAAGAFRIEGRSAAALARLGAINFDDAPAAEPAKADGALIVARFIAGVLDRRLRSVEFLDSMLPVSAKLP
jgi:DNA repair protein RecO (recombination protein O)